MKTILSDRRNLTRIKTGVLVALIAMATAVGAHDRDDTTPYLPALPRVVSTIPSNGDVNPYGVAFVTNGFPGGGVLHAGDVLVSNFNNSQNLQGTGTTITRIPATGTPSTFFQTHAGAGLTAALVVLRAGYVIVGNLPTADGTAATVQPGSLLIVDKNGNLAANISDAALIDGPWGAAVRDEGSHVTLFVSNVLNGTVVRLHLHIDANGVTVGKTAVIASGYNHRTDPAALVLGPSGLLYNAANDVLYVASSFDNAVYALYEVSDTTQNQGNGRLIYQDPAHLHGALMLAKAPNGHLLVANSDGSNVDLNQPSELVEFTTEGMFIGQLSVDPINGGAFGLAVEKVRDDSSKLAAVDDNANTLTIWTIISAD
jgi:hypothetical protein